MFGEPEIRSWYAFANRLPLYYCMHLVNQMSPQQLDEVIKGLKGLHP